MTREFQEKKSHQIKCYKRKKQVEYQITRAQHHNKTMIDFKWHAANFTKVSSIYLVCHCARLLN
jgi:hypothetical protein